MLECAMFSAELIASVADAAAGPAVVFVMVRNEMLRLPAFLSHYRAAGVRRFVAVDNGSTDGGGQFLTAQPDVRAVQTAQRYGAANFGLDWLNAFHAQMTPGRWVLFADADELLVYRGWPQRELACLLAAAEAAGANAVQGFMLDMYPDGPVDDAHPADDLLAAASLFDADYIFRERPHPPWRSPPPEPDILGGPRLRLLSTLAHEQRAGWLTRLAQRKLGKIVDRLPQCLPRPATRLLLRQLPALRKVPLLRAGTGYYGNAHYVTGNDGGSVSTASESCVLLHFKFLADFAARVRIEAARGEHYRRGAEYKMYAAMLAQRGVLDLRYSGSVRFAGADNLDARGWFDINALAAGSAARSSRIAPARRPSPAPRAAAPRQS